MLSVSVFVCAYNEAQTLADVVREISATLHAAGRPHELVIIDDGSNDGTGEIADALSREVPEVAVIHHEQNLGLGSAYQTAFTRARRDLLTFFSADGQFPARLLDQLLPLADDHDMVLGYLPRRASPWCARLLSRAERLLLYLLFGRLPRFQGMLVFRRQLLREIVLVSGGGRAWTIVMELIIRVYRRGYRTVSVPTETCGRISGKSKVTNVGTVWENLRQLLRLRLRMLTA